MLKAVIFDMDGTLLDSEPMHQKTVLMLLEKLKISSGEAYSEKLTGADYETIWENNIKTYNIVTPLDEILKMQNDITYEYFSETDFAELPGVTALLRDLSENNILTAVASSAPESIIDLVLKKLNIISYMDSVCGIESVKRSKPAPDLFVLAAERLGVRPENCIVIEDSLVGVTAAKRAGMKCVLIRNRSTAREALDKADRVIDSFYEIDFLKINEMFNSADDR